LKTRRLSVFSPITLWTVIVFAAGTAAAQSPECVALTRQALEASGFNQEIDSSVRILDSDEFMAQIAGGQDMPVEVIEAFKKAVKNQMNAEQIKNEVLQKLATGCRPELMQQAVERMQTPFVAHMLELEAQASTPAGQAKVKRYADALKVAPPTDDRIDAMHALDESLGMTNFQLESSLQIIGAILAGFGVPPPSEDDVRKQRSTMREQAQAGVETSLLLVYRGVPRADLDRYAKELRSEPLHGFFNGMRKVFLEVMTVHSRAMAEDLKTFLPARRS
jgi:hypothetical protein